MKRKIGLMLAVTMAAALFTGCGGGGASQTEAPQQSQGGQETQTAGGEEKADKATETQDGEVTFTFLKYLIPA